MKTKKKITLKRKGGKPLQCVYVPPSFTTLKEFQVLRHHAGLWEVARPSGRLSYTGDDIDPVEGPLTCGKSCFGLFSLL